jgi:ankyrin repeat protein
MKRALVVTALITLFATPQISTADVDGLFLDAVRVGDTAGVQRLLDGGARIDAADQERNTALMIAAAFGNAELTRTLIARGADVNARGYIGNTALIFAAQEGNIEVVRLLVDGGADVGVKNKYGATAAKLASGWGHREVVQILGTGQRSPWMDGNGIAQQIIHALIGIVAIVAVPALTAKAVYASAVTTHSHPVN